MGDLSQLGSVLPSVGGAGIFLVIISVLFRLLTRANNRETELREAYAAERDKTEQAHNDEVSELRGRIDELNRRVDELQARLDDEREQRRRAQDDAAEALRQAVARDG